MALTVINQPSVGTLAGQSLGQGIQGLVQQRLADTLQQRQQSKLAENLQSLGLPAALAGVSPQLQSLFAKQQIQAPQQASYVQALEALQRGEQPELGGLGPEHAKNIVQLQQQKIQDEFLRQNTEALRSLREKTAAGTQEEKTLKRIETTNKPYLERLSKGVDLAANIKDKASQMLDLLNTGKVASGVSGYVPGVFQSPETQQFDALANELATFIAGNAGVATNFKIKTAQEYKPNIRQSPITQRARLNDLVDKANDIILTDRIKNKIIEQNNGEQPKNIESKIRKKLHIYKKLPDASLYDEGTVGEENGIKFQIIDGQWNEIS